MSDRPVRLDLRAQADAHAGSQTSLSHNGGGARERPTDDQLDRFRHAMSGGVPSEESEEAKDALASPFALFGLARAASLAAEPVAAGASNAASCASLLSSEIADRILISEDDPREARIVIRDDILSGVEVRVARDQGRWSVKFIVTDRDSLQLLERSADAIATQLAQRLGCEVEVQVIDAARSSDEPVCIFRAIPDENTGDES